MRNHLKILGWIIITACFLGTFSSCKKAATIPLGALPSLDFDAVPNTTNPNKITFVNKSKDPVITYWKIGNDATMTDGVTFSHSFVFSGTYKVTMIGVGQGGMDSVSKEVVIKDNDPDACIGTVLGFIAGCTSKTWKLNPGAGAYKVGDSKGSGNWWSSGDGDVAARSCEFNDEYTFHFDANSTFEYDNKGDFYADGALGNKTNGCEPTANYTASQRPWGSGTFKYSLAEDKGVNRLGQLTVIGLGAHMGLQKVKNGGEDPENPVQSITYDILETITDAVNGDRLVLGVKIGGDGWWTFTFRSF